MAHKKKDYVKYCEQCDKTKKILMRILKKRKNFIEDICVWSKKKLWQI